MAYRDLQYETDFTERMAYWDLPYETDFTERMATVYLCKRPVRSSFSDSINVNMEALWHWSLVCKFEGGGWRTAEGMDDSRGKIVPVYNKQRPLEFDFSNKLGEVRLSPYRLWYYVVTNQHNDTIYSTVFKNCQHWLYALCCNISPEIAENTKTHLTIMDAVVGTTAVAALGTMAFLFVKLAGFIYNHHF